MPEWTDPKTWEVGEKVRAADLNAMIRDNLKVLVGMRAVKAEATGAAIRSSDEWGPFDDDDGPVEVAFRTGPQGHAVLALYGHGRVTERDGGVRGFMSYEIERVEDSEIVVGPSELRSCLWRDDLGASASFVWLEDDTADALEADQEYVARIVGKITDDGDVGAELDVSHRRIVVWDVRESQEPS